MLSQFLPQDVLDRLSFAEADTSLLSEEDALHEYPGPEHEIGRRCFSLSEYQETHFPFVNIKTGEVITDISGKSVGLVWKRKLMKVLSEEITCRYVTPAAKVVKEKSLRHPRLSTTMQCRLWKSKETVSSSLSRTAALLLATYV